MKILLYYSFAEEDVAEFRRIAAAGGHKVIHKQFAFMIS